MVDASPVGLGVILTQIDRNGKSAVVAYARKAPTPTEQRYSQIDHKMLAVVSGCRKFGFYLRGCEFTIWTDHKPLVPIFNNPKSRLTIRMDRFMFWMQDFSPVVKYLPGGYNAADYLSRHPEKNKVAVASMVLLLRPATARKRSHAILPQCRGGPIWSRQRRRSCSWPRSSRR